VLLGSGGPASAETGQGKAGGEAGKLFVDVSAADYVEVIDLAGRQTIDRIKVGMHPHGLTIGPGKLSGSTTGTGREGYPLFVTVEDTGQLVVVDANSHHVLRRLKVGKVPNQLTLTVDGRFAYVPLREEASVAVVELEERFWTSSMRMTDGRIKSLPASEYHAKLLKKIPIGEWPHNAYTGETTGRIYVTSFRGQKIHVFDPAKHELLFEIELPGEVRPVALTRDETRAYVALSGFHGFVVVDIASRTVIRRIELPPLPPDTPEPYLKTYVHGLVLSPDERTLWVTSCAGAAVYAYSVPEIELVGQVPVVKFPHWFAWQPPVESKPYPEGWLLWVSQMESNQVSAIDPATSQVVATLPTGPAPRRIVILPPGSP
jgi:YVTN family beta-propeller protein